MFEPLVQPADIFFSASNGFLGRGIRWATRHRGEEKTLFNHVGVFVEPDRMGQATLVEASGRVRVSRIDESYRDTDCLIAVARPLGLTDDEKGDIAFDAIEKVGNKYGWMKIIGFLGDALLSKIFGGDPVFFRRLFFFRSRPVCSQVVAELYQEYGYSFGVPGGYATPDQIWDFVLTHPKKYEIIFGPTRF